MADEKVLAQLIQALPQAFTFYHLGEVRLDDEPAPLAGGSATGLTAPLVSEDRLAVAFSLEGDARGALVLLFESGLDVSTYSELGNVIASRMATRLADQRGLDVSISPPRLLTRAQLASLAANAPGGARTYLHHRSEGRPVSLQALVISNDSLAHSAQRTIGNA